MTTKSDIIKIIESLKEAKEGSRVLSDEILLILGWHFSSRTTISYSINGERLEYGWYDPSEIWFGKSANNRPDPTSNLQDMKEAIPKGWMLKSITTNGLQSGENNAEVSLWRTTLHPKKRSKGQIDGEHPTDICLSGCIAIMKAAGELR